MPPPAPPAAPPARVLVVTGAGISAESGIPTFRGPGGLWRNFDPTKLATEAAFRADPALVWQWYRERREGIRRARPNAAHEAVVRLAAGARDFLLLTQNVDDLHARATWRDRRLAPAQLVRIHGDIFATRCLECDFARAEGTEDAAGVPRCPRCAGPLRPGVVWFGESLPGPEIARVEAFLAAGPCDHVIVVGTTAAFGYIVDWALAARGRSGRLVEINPEPTPLSAQADECLREPAATALPRLVEALLGPAAHVA